MPSETGAPGCESGFFAVCVGGNGGGVSVALRSASSDTRGSGAGVAAAREGVTGPALSGSVGEAAFTLATSVDAAADGVVGPLGSGAFGTAVAIRNLLQSASLPPASR